MNGRQGIRCSFTKQAEVAGGWQCLCNCRRGCSLLYKRHVGVRACVSKAMLITLMLCFLSLNARFAFPNVMMLHAQTHHAGRFPIIKRLRLIDF